MRLSSHLRFKHSIATNAMRTLISCPGIGDFLWMAMHLTNASERFHIRMSESLPQRGHQLAEILPDIIASHEYRGVIQYKDVYRNNIQTKKNKWKQITEESFYLSANDWLEKGNRIEGWLEDLPVSFKLNYHTSEQDKQTAAALLPEGKKYIGIYTSAYSNARHWNGWGAEEWMALILSLSKEREDSNICFVLIGAPYDIGIPEQLMESMDELAIPYVNTIGQPLGVVVEILKRQSYFIGFPSGLSILNETMGKDGTMFYPAHLKKMMNAWPDPKRIEEGNYKGCLFPEPELIFQWIRDKYQLYDRI
jgi:hypothetical protein